MAEAGRVLFYLTDNALIVANSGEQFTREGVIAICHMHLSEKMKKPQDIFDKDLIRAIAESKVGKYSNLNELISDAGGEEALGKDQYGRFVWELLQNADDAATRSKENIPSRLIGAKGLGFRSILEISDSPEIYSGDFNFRFSREDSRRMLENNGVSVENDIPAFSIPHPCKPNGKCAALLKDGYSTVIRLPFAHDKVKEAEKQLGKLDASCLLFCQRLFRIEIEIRGESRIIELNRDGIFGFEQGKATFTLQENNEIRKWRRWSVVWSPENNAEAKQLSVALCLRMGENEEVAMDEECPVHVFFPTASEVCVPGLKALLHASYNLQSNREHFDREQPHGETIRDKIGGLASDILMDIPAATALRAFGKIFPAKNNKEKTEIGRLKSTFAAVVGQTPFIPVIGGEKVRPAEARIWRHELGKVLRAQHPDVRSAKLLIPFLSAEQDVRSILEKFEAKSAALHEHATLLRLCRSDTLNACHAAWQVAGKIACEANKSAGPEYIIHADRRRDANTVLATLKEAPIWWTEAESSRPLNGDVPLLRERPRKWPEWLKADALSSKFRMLLGGAAKKAGDPPTLVDSLRKSGVWPLHDAHSYFTGALLPFCEGMDSERWEEMGWDVLQWAFRWGGGEVRKLQPSIIGGGDKVNRIDEGLIRLPTNKGWLPAIQCYAGKDWDGPVGFDKYFQAQEARDWGILMPFEEWKLPPEMHDDKKKWKEFLRGLGASWGLKIRRVSLNDIPKNLAGLIGEYKQQRLAKIKRGHSSAYCVSGGESTFIENFPDALAECRPADAFRAVKSVEQLAKEAGETRLEYLYQRGPGETKSAESFALFQLQHDKWVPCRPGLLDAVGSNKNLIAVRPGDAFMPECKLDGIAPVVRKPDDWSPDKWGNVYGTLKELGVRTEKPASSDKNWWRGRMDKLAKIAKELGEDSEDLLHSQSKHGKMSALILRFYGVYGESLAEMGNVPYLVRIDKSEFIAFGPLKGVFWADKPYHGDADVRQSLLDKGFKLFPFFLQKGKRFGIKPLSDFVSETRDEDESPDMTREIQNRLNLRKKMLALVAGKPEGIFAFAKKIKGCSSLALVLKEKNTRQKIAQPEVDFYMTQNALFVNASGNKWRALAAGVAAWSQLPEEKAPIFEGLLREEETREGDNECRKRLRLLGISDSELTEVDDDQEFDSFPPQPFGQALDLDKLQTPDNGEKPAFGRSSGNNPPSTPIGRTRVGGGGWGSGGGNPDVEEAAVEVVSKYYGEGNVCSVEKDNKGWDLEVARPGGEILQVEVKGISASRISVKLTPNEYSKSDNDVYRLAVVRNALNDNLVAIYKRCGNEWWKVDGNDEDASQRLVVEEETGAKIKEDGKR